MTTEKLHLSWELFERGIASMESSLIGERSYDYTIALERGGVFPAHLLQRGNPKHYGALISVRPDAIWTLPEEIIQSPRLLFVDDIWDSGATILRLAEIFPEARFCTLCSKVTHTIPQHTYGILLDTPDWIVFPWEVRDAENRRVK